MTDPIRWWLARLARLAAAGVIAEHGLLGRRGRELNKASSSA